MGPKLMMFLLFVFFIGNFISLIGDGEWFGDADMDITNHLTGYSVIELSGAGFWSIPKAGIGFLTDGLPRVLMWDYSYLQGDWMLLRMALVFFISAPMMWGVFQVFLPVLQGIFSKFL